MNRYQMSEERVTFSGWEFLLSTLSANMIEDLNKYIRLFSNYDIQYLVDKSWSNEQLRFHGEHLPLQIVRDNTVTQESNFFGNYSMIVNRYANIGFVLFGLHLILKHLHPSRNLVFLINYCTWECNSRGDMCNMSNQQYLIRWENSPKRKRRKFSIEKISVESVENIKIPYPIEIFNLTFKKMEELYRQENNAELQKV